MAACATCGKQNPPEAAFCMACGHALGPSRAPREVRKTVTVVFCDMTGSTALGERLDPESLRDVQTRYFDAMRAAIERHGGTVEKYIGDAVMAVFGIPSVHEDDALRATRAAADMRSALDGLNKELDRDRGATIDIRIGVNTGEVVASDPTAGQALVTGDAVNVAARLEQHAAPGTVLIGESTYRLVRGVIEAEPMEPLAAKGKVEPVTGWRLIGVGDVTSPPRPHPSSRMIGRGRHVRQLRESFEAVVHDRVCHLFTVLGPPGVGKSRLVEEFTGRLSDEARVLRGRCLPYGEGITYYPVVEAIKQAAGLADFDLPEVVQAKVCSLLEGDEHRDVICGHLTQLMGVGETSAGEETFWAIRRLFEAIARDRPLVLIFDDIHFGEPTFLDLVEHIADWSRGSAILLLCMARGDLLELRQQWGGGKLNSTTVSLGALDADETRSLIANLLEDAPLAATTIDRIAETAEGNPLFVEQTLEMLINDGVLKRDGDRWVEPVDPGTFVLPPSIHALLAARLDRLDADERATIEAAAVVGNEFFVGAVREMVDEHVRPDVPTHLMSLVRKEFVRQDRSSLPGEDAFGFRHLTIRDAAYAAIPKSQRAELHARFAAWLEGVAGDAVAEQEEIVGYHLEQAHEYLTALGPSAERSDELGAHAATFLARAGRRARDRRDDAAASNLFTRALAVAPPTWPDRAATALALSDSLELVGDPHNGLASAEEAIRVAVERGDRSLEWRGRIWRAYYVIQVDPHRTSTSELRAELERAVVVFEELGDELGSAMAWMGLAELEWMPCRFDTAARALRTAVEHARRSGDRRARERAVTSLIAAQMVGTTSSAEVRRTLDDELSPLLPNKVLESAVLNTRASLSADDGDFERARGYARAAFAMMDGLGFELPAFLGVMMETEAYIERLAGNHEAAEARYRRVDAQLERQGDAGHRSSSSTVLARVLCSLERYDEAERFARIGLGLGAPDDVAAQADARAVQALVRSARGHHTKAERLAREAVAIYQDAGAECPHPVGDAWRDLALVLRHAGRRAEAEDAARQALTLYESKGVRPKIAEAESLIEELRHA